MGRGYREDSYALQGYYLRCVVLCKYEASSVVSLSIYHALTLILFSRLGETNAPWMSKYGSFLSCFFVHIMHLHSFSFPELGGTVGKFVS